MKHLSILSLMLAATVHAADPKPAAETFLDAASAGRDYLDQGEYKNDWGGAQVIALGEENFRMVTYRGGLPGDGWDREFKQETPGKRSGGRILFTAPNNYRAELADGKISITTENGGPYIMEKTERRSPTLGAKPPVDGIVLFDGTSVEAWTAGHLDDRHLLASPVSLRTSNSFFRSSRWDAGRTALTAAFTCRTAMKCRCSIRSDSKARTTNAAPSMHKQRRL